jgi:ABC-type nitrate/sulfonate/bicarbonate transport system substrate-binding protein
MRVRFGFLVCFFFLSSLLVFASAKKERYPQEVAISYVESPFNLQLMVMKEKGMLEQAFGEKHIKVQWHAINSGAYQTQAMAAGSLDIASVINSISVIMANAAGNRVKIAGMVSRPTQTFALLTGADGPQSIQDLKGKTVAGPKGTVLHQLLIAALGSQGLSINDVNFISMDLPEARTALLSGTVDAALLAASLIIRGEEAGLKVLFTADGYVNPLLITAVRPEFAKKYPELLDIYLKTQQEAYNWILHNTEEAVAIGAKTQQISPEDGMSLYTWSGMDSSFTQKDLTGMAADVTFLLEQQMIDQSIDPADIVLPVAFGK